MNPSTLILYRDRAGRYRWTEKAGNGEPVARSAQGKGYASARNRNNGLMAAARGFGVWLDPDIFPRCGKWASSVLRSGAHIIIRNDDDK